MIVALTKLSYTTGVSNGIDTIHLNAYIKALKQIRSEFGEVVSKELDLPDATMAALYQPNGSNLSGSELIGAVEVGPSSEWLASGPDLIFETQEILIPSMHEVVIAKEEIKQYSIYA
jgi:hypothetical protein